MARFSEMAVWGGRAVAAPIERERELAAIDAFVTQLTGGDGRILAVEGPAGIGKTDLLRAARERATALGLRVLTARASELERDLPYGIPRQWFSPTLMTAAAAERERLFSGAATLAGPVLEDIDASTGLQGAMHGLLWFAANVAESVPLLLVVDDAHWADEASARLLNHLAPRLEGLPIALLIATRPPDVSAAGELVAHLLADPSVEVLRPAPLSCEAAAELLAGGLATDPEPAFAAACWEATGGNPFLLTGLARALAADGATGRDTEIERVHAVRPGEIGRSLLTRLSREARSIARALAILDEPAELSLLSELAAVPEGRAATAAEELARAGVVEDIRPLRFVHGIVQAAVAAQMTAGERSAAHSSAARLLRARDADAERVAIHLLETDPQSDQTTVAILQEAAASARRRGAPEVTVRLLRRALAEPPRGPAEGEILAALGYAEHDLDMPEALDHLWAASQQATDRLLAARALLHSTWAAGTRWNPPDTFGEAFVAAHGDAMRQDPETALMFEAARITAQWLGALSDDGLAERVTRLSALTGDTPGECAVLAVLARLAMDRGEPAAVVADLARRATRQADALTEQGANSTWLLHSSLALRTCELFDEAEQLLESAVAHARATGSATGYAIARANQSGLALRRGDVRRAEELARSALESGGSRGWYRAGATTYLVEALLARGGLDEADAELTTTLALLGAEPDGPIPRFRPLTPILIARGQLRRAQGRAERARADLEEGVERIVRFSRSGTQRSDAVGLDARLQLAELEYAAGERQDALRRTREALAVMRHWGTPGAIGMALRVHGRLTGGDEGVTLLRDAVDHLARSPLGLEQAMALLDLGAALRRANARSDAREPLREAVHRAEAGGATVIAESARAELAQTGIRVRRENHRDRLTPSEQRIAEMAAGGSSNPQIAQALFITTKTVETHLMNAYRKLGINSRRELPRALAASRSL